MHGDARTIIGQTTGPTTTNGDVYVTYATSLEVAAEHQGPLSLGDEHESELETLFVEPPRWQEALLVLREQHTVLVGGLAGSGQGVGKVAVSRC
jgi:hypothetical protein